MINKCYHAIKHNQFYGFYVHSISNHSPFILGFEFMCFYILRRLNHFIQKSYSFLLNLQKIHLLMNPRSTRIKKTTHTNKLLQRYLIIETNLNNYFRLHICLYAHPCVHVSISLCITLQCFITLVAIDGSSSRCQT